MGPAAAYVLPPHDRRSELSPCRQAALCCTNLGSLGLSGTFLLRYQILRDNNVCGNINGPVNAFSEEFKRDICRKGSRGHLLDDHATKSFGRGHGDRGTTVLGSTQRKPRELLLPPD